MLKRLGNVQTIIDELVFFKQQTFPRGDYLFMINTALAFLGYQPLDIAAEKELPPVSHARWMSKVIHFFILFMFKDHYEIPPRSSLKWECIEEICVFGVLYYIKYFLMSTNSVAAVRLDLQLLKDIQNIDDQVAKNAVTKKFKGHLWYLSEQLSPLAFFDNAVSIDEKNQMRKNIKTALGNPKNLKKFQVFPSNFNPKTANIRDFVTKNSISFFEILEIEPDFLDKDAKDWSTDRSYLKALEAIEGLTVINDSAERAVALAKDFGTGRTKDEKQVQKIFHSVSHARKMFPIRTKRAYIAKTD